ncbi:MAG TPA: sigma-70 family RNA polymerase sigma factor [Caulobacterales bacterium]|nr:sigma-70 family RNA polymerase sigma factor [Caulobacterales bacterium]
MADEAHLRTLFLQGRDGDAAAHRTFLMEAAALLRAYFRNRLRNAPEDAEDLVQETLVALHTKRDTYDPMYPLTSWIYAIAKYRLIDHVRRKQRRGPHESIDDVELGDLAPDYEASDAKRDITALLAKLPPKQRDAIRLVKLEEKSVREAAQITGFSESDIKISIHRGLKALMRLLAEEGAT